jgi:hypothetical protein
MKKLIVFDLDGTRAESKSSLDEEMSRLLDDLLGIVRLSDFRSYEGPVIQEAVQEASPRFESFA